MQQPFSNSSFIPKKSIKRVERVRGRRRVYVLSYVAYAIFFGTVLAAVAVFLYSSVLQGQLEAKTAELDAQRASFEQSDLETIRAWENKLRVAEVFFGHHTSPYRVLSELEKSTASDIRFTSFSYSVSSQGAPALITLSGETDRFDSVAFQDDVFGRSEVLSSASISGVTKAIGTNVASQESESSSEVAAAKPVTFAVALEVPSSNIKFDTSAYEQFFQSSSSPIQSFTVEETTQSGGDVDTSDNIDSAVDDTTVESADSAIEGDDSIEGTDI